MMECENKPKNKQILQIEKNWYVKNPNLCLVRYRQSAAEQLKTALPATNPVSSRMEDFNKEPPDFKFPVPTKTLFQAVLFMIM